MKKILLCLLVFTLAALQMPAQAQNADAGAKDKGVKYVPVNLQNISQVLFRKGVLKTSDPAAVEEFIRINYCGLYEQYARDDFAWTRLREAQARDIDVHLDLFPEAFEISNVVIADRFDMATNVFLLRADSRMDNMGNVTLLDELRGTHNGCGEGSQTAFVPRVHPLNLVVRLDNPVTLDGFPLSRAKADELIASMNSRDTKEKNRRSLLMTMNVRIIGADPLSVVTNPLQRTIMGHIDEIRIYDSPRRTVLLFKKTFENQPASSNKN